MSRAGGISRRVWRFIEAIKAEPMTDLAGSPVAELALERQALFLKMLPADQVHSLRVYRSIERVGYHDPVVLEAALLHDCGKAWPRPRLWVRVLVDVTESTAPSWLRWLERKRWPIGRIVRGYRLHGYLGSRAAREAGCSPRVVALIRACGGQASLRLHEPSPSELAERWLAATGLSKGSDKVQTQSGAALTPDPLAHILRRFDSAF